MIISILGTTGAKKDNESCLPIELEKASKAFYNAEVLKKESKKYYNSTDFLLENYDDKFLLIGTDCAVKFQSKLLENSLKNRKVEFKTISDNDLDEVFELIFNILEDTNDKIILDVTHGFRHQPIMAIFATTLSKFLSLKNVDIIFAKEVISFKKYEYIYLNEYVEISHISMLLSGFIRTYNFIPLKGIKLINVKVFESFSKALLSNDIKGVKKWHKELIKELNNISQNKELKYLLPMVEKIKSALNVINSFNTLPIYKQYIELSKLTLDKNYLIIALAYSFESLREYCSSRFEPLIKNKNIKFKSSYNKNMDVMATISDFRVKNKDNIIQKNYPNIYKKNKNSFQRIDSVYQEIRKLRNDLAHINQTKEFEDVKKEVIKLNYKIESIYKDDVLKYIKA